MKVTENFVYYLVTLVKIWSVRIVFSPRFWGLNQIINKKYTVQISLKHVDSCQSDVIKKTKNNHINRILSNTLLFLTCSKSYSRWNIMIENRLINQIRISSFHLISKKFVFLNITKNELCIAWKWRYLL